MDRARKAGNLRPMSKVHSNPIPDQTEDSSPNLSRKRKSPDTTGEGANDSHSGPKRKLRNSDIFPPSVRPDWLLEDGMINSLPRATVATVIAQSKMTEAINKQNKLREEKADKSRGGLRKDEEIKRVSVKAGEDDAMNVLHPQRFLLRTPLTKPESYWDMVPVKWPETNKRLQLAHLGLDHVISARTKELVHDRADVTINIKMLS